MKIKDTVGHCNAPRKKEKRKQKTHLYYPSATWRAARGCSPLDPTGPGSRCQTWWTQKHAWPSSGSDPMSSTPSLAWIPKGKIMSTPAIFSHTLCCTLAGYLSPGLTGREEVPFLLGRSTRCPLCCTLESMTESVSIIRWEILRYLLFMSPPPETITTVSVHHRRDASAQLRMSKRKSYAVWKLCSCDRHFGSFPPPTWTVLLRVTRATMEALSPSATFEESPADVHVNLFTSLRCYVRPAQRVV